MARALLGQNYANLGEMARAAESTRTASELLERLKSEKSSTSPPISRLMSPETSRQPGRFMSCGARLIHATRFPPLTWV
jgi:hypothetical protein